MPTILITGANRGLGLEFTRQYLADGWQVIATCRTPQRAASLQALAKQHKNLQIETLDVGDPSSISALANTIKDVAVDILLNNAGIYSGLSQSISARDDDKAQEFGTLDADGWNKVLQINSIAPIMVTQTFLPNIKRGHERKIIFISSRMGSITRTSPGYIAYRSSKATLNAAMRNVALALQPDKITVISFHPGWVQTDMGGANADITPETSITGMRKVIAGLTIEQTGQFLNYDGDVLPW